MKVSFKNQTIFIDKADYTDNETYNLDFNGHYLVEAIFKNKKFCPTGNAINGYGHIISFDLDDLITEDKDV